MHAMHACISFTPLTDETNHKHIATRSCVKIITPASITHLLVRYDTLCRPATYREEKHIRRRKKEGSDARVVWNLNKCRVLTRGEEAGLGSN